MRKLYKIKLYGSLGKKFGKEPITLYGTYTSDLMQGLITRFGDKFRETIVKGSWHITLGKRTSDKLKETDNFLSEELLSFPLFEEELHIFPAVIGAGGKGVGQMILGAVLIVAAVAVTFFTGGTGAFASWGAFTTAMGASTVASSLAMAGALSIAGGLMTMMSGALTMNQTSAPTNERQSFIYNGVINTNEQGGPVPLIYGIHMAGSTVISAGMDVYQL